MKRVISICIAFIISNHCLAQESKKNYDEAFKIIDVWIKAQKDYKQYPGISVAVIKDQEELWSAAYGLSNLDDNKKMSTNTLCSICSISKLFTSVAIMKLYDEGKLRLDDEVEDLLPWFNLKQKYKTSGPVTVRSLLTHSSGLPRESDYPYWNGPDFKFPSKEEVKSMLGNQETLYPSSETFQYSNLGMTLLGEIVEEVSGIPFNDYVKNNILTPLNLKDTRPEMPASLYGEQLAKGYSAIYRDLKRKPLKLFNANAITPAAGFSSNVTDLGKFASWQFRLRESEETEILKPSTLRNMHTVHWMNPDFSTTWGLGFVVFKGADGSKWISHGGSCPGYRSSFHLNPKTKMAYAVMINANGTNPGDISRNIHSVLMKTENIESDINEVTANDSTKIDLSDYTGYYSNQPWWSDSYYSSWNGKLVSIDLVTDELANSMTFYEHLEGDTFVRLSDSGEKRETLKFFRDDNGVVNKAKVHGTFRERIKEE